ncbi:hypothetical protein CANMA_002032 [Candida margitis]|uniref:uncharacterized protein n=1 Tax=Candida margitis TaxID=1775924 RepID=UPI00222793E6|nr:uncharacterized protein CANMA_002032 [Candida margitis]KAI5968858.1 hypothetical protein CANMA_002032 [Candida margitis]
MSDIKADRVLRPLDAKAAFDVVEIDKQTYRGVKPLRKPAKEIRGVYGGNIVGQGILVAMRSSPSGFTPNSVHSHFIKAVNEETPLIWKVEEVSTGKSFATRKLRALQDDVVVFTSMVSLTSKNSASKTGHKDSTQMEYSVPPGKTLTTQSLKGEPSAYAALPLFVYQKFYEDQKDKDTYAFQLRWGIKDDANFYQEHQNVTPEFKYVGLTILTDWVAVELAVPHVGMEVPPKFETSIDHNIYYHEDDFDIDQWFVYVLGFKWIGNDRALVKADLYTEDNKHVVTIVQERLYITSSKL